MVGKILAIFWEPSRTFKALKVNTAWLDVLIPLILMMAVTLAAVPQITPIALQEQKARIENSERLSDEQKAAFLSSIEQRSLSITQYVSIILVTVLKLILVAGVLHMIANFIFGGESRFIQLLALSAYGQLVDVVSLAIKTPLKSIPVRRSSSPKRAHFGSDSPPAWIYSGSGKSCCLGSASEYSARCAVAPPGWSLA